MAVAVADFYTAFPEFQPYGFQNAAITFWITFAQSFVNQTVWGAPAATGQPYSPYDYGVMFYAAHFIALAVQRGQQVGPLSPVQNPAVGAIGATGTPGATVGVVSNKQVDKVSVSYDIAGVMEEGAGQWNKTSYGQMFARLARQFGNAPLYVGIGPLTDTPIAWGGPGFPFPGWFAW